MQTLRAVRTAAVRFGLSLLAAGLAFGSPAKAAWDKPWQSEDRALVIDAYEFNPIDWKALTSDKRIVGFINKASDGLPPDWNCRKKSGDEELLCKNRWWKYTVTKELYMTRRAMAKELGLKWGAYHLGRPGNPREQADHFIDFAEPDADELIALDIEDNTSEWMSLADAEVFANQIFIRTGRYPVLYTNGSTAKWISDYKDKYKLLSRLQLWYARYAEDISGKFPENTWPNYALWQFSSMHNCTAKKCPYRVKGAKSDIDVNVSTLDVAGLRAAWPFDGLVRPIEAPPEGLVAGLGRKAGNAVTAIADTVVSAAEPAIDRIGSAFAAKAPAAPVAAEAPPVAVPAKDVTPPAAAAPAASTLVAAYAPSEAPKAPVDPLKLLTETARKETAAHGKPAVAVAVAPVPTPAPAATAFSALAPEMRRVAAIVPTPSAPVRPAPVAKVAAFGPAQKSRMRAWLLAAEAKGKVAGLPAPGAALSQLAAKLDGRGARLGGRTADASADGRVSAAFDATQ